MQTDAVSYHIFINIGQPGKISKSTHMQFDPIA